MVFIGVGAILTPKWACIGMIGVLFEAVDVTVMKLAEVGGRVCVVIYCFP